MALVKKYRRLIPTQIDFSKVASGSLASTGHFLAIDTDGKAILATGSGDFLSKYKVRQSFVESPNGSRVVFTAPSNYVEGSEMVFRDGMLMNSGSDNDYVLTPPKQVTFNDEDPPDSQEILLITYVQV
jgi:hypothetical protein